MNRRSFFKRGALFISGGALTGFSGFLKPGLAVGALLPTDFSIDVVTGDSDRAIRQIEQIIRHTDSVKRPVKFAEYGLLGSHLGDIAYTQSRRLIDFRRDTGEMSQQLRHAAAALGLPRRVDNPVLLRFYTEIQGAPADAHVFRGNTLLARLPLKTAAVHPFDGMQGPLELAIENQAAEIASVTCRHKTCMKMGAISRSGQHLVCIPNQITVAIAGANALGVDGISR